MADWTRLTRRAALALSASSVYAAGTQRSAGAADTLEAALAEILPPGLKPAWVGASVQSAEPAPFATCLARAGAPGPAAQWDWVGEQVRADFAEGRITVVDGWHLSRTEAWLCAALHAA